MTMYDKKLQCVVHYVLNSKHHAKVDDCDRMSIARASKNFRMHGNGL